MRDILNTALVAEKQALATVIARREETAPTHSLLNTAKLMDENQTLRRLKELEYLERICERVGSISLSSGSDVERRAHCSGNNVGRRGLPPDLLGPGGAPHQPSALAG